MKASRTPNSTAPPSPTKAPQGHVTQADSEQPRASNLSTNIQSPLSLSERIAESFEKSKVIFRNKGELHSIPDGEGQLYSIGKDIVDIITSFLPFDALKSLQLTQASFAGYGLHRMTVTLNLSDIENPDFANRIAFAAINRVTLKIECTDVRQFDELKVILSFLKEQKAPFWLNLKKILVTKDNAKAVQGIISKLSECITLQCLAIGNIEKGASVNFTQLPSNLQRLALGSISGDASVDFSSLSVTLQSLTLGFVADHANVKLPELPSLLQCLNLNNLWEGTLIDLTRLPASLKSLTINDLYTKETRPNISQLPSTLQCLAIGSIWDNSIDLSNLPATLQSLTMGYLHVEATVDLYDLPSVIRHLAIRVIDGTLILAESLPNLQTITCKRQGNGAKIINLDKLPEGVTLQITG